MYFSLRIKKGKNDLVLKAKKQIGSSTRTWNRYKKWINRINWNMVECWFSGASSASVRTKQSVLESKKNFWGSINKSSRASTFKYFYD